EPGALVLAPEDGLDLVRVLAADVLVVMPGSQGLRAVVDRPFSGVVDSPLKGADEGGGVEGAAVGEHRDRGPGVAPEDVQPAAEHAGVRTIVPAIVGPFDEPNAGGLRGAGHGTPV